MKENKRMKLYILVALVFSILTISIAYAVLSTSLDISGSATVQESSWGFKLGEGISLSGKDYETTGSAIYNEPTFDGVTATYNFSLSKPGDSVTYFFRIYSLGSLPGEISSILTSNPTCTSSLNVKSDEELVCNNLLYEITYSDGTPIQTGDVFNKTSLNTPAITCLKGAYTGNVRSIKVKITFDDKVTSVPSSTVTVNNLKTTIDLKQTDKVCNKDNTSPEPS
jgi:hypothetical protein